MTISAKIIADSISPEGVRLTTFSLEYPRFIHAEVLTHRVFSRNASSSRAIPVAKMLERIKIDPAMPIHWGANQPGMQANYELDIQAKLRAKDLWLESRDNAIAIVEKLLKIGLHKQVANRLLEPWSHINVVLSGTEFGNFYNLRNHEAAQPEIKELAQEMLSAHNDSTPIPINYRQWHIPYVTNDEIIELGIENALKCSVARCARVSYLNHEGKKTTLDEDLKLYWRLLGNFPIHASPSEHQATPTTPAVGSIGNFTGWLQYRKTLKGENATDYSGLIKK